MGKWIKCPPWDGSERKYSHLKRDGICLQVVKNADGSTSWLTPKNSHDFRALPCFDNFRRRAPRSTVLFGELWYPGRKASHVLSAMTTLDTQLAFDVFAITQMNGFAISPREPLEALQAECDLWGVSFAPWFEGMCGWYHDENGREYLPPDQEGWVYKDGNLLNLSKWKPTRTIEAVVTDVTKGRGKHLGRVGALVCSVLVPTPHSPVDERQYVVIANVSGMDDLERESMSKNDIGRVVEIEYDYVGDGGKLRFPRFVRWRDDRTKEDCVAEQDTELSEFHLE